MYFPSGEYAGFPSNPGCVVIRFGSPPLTGTTNKCERFPSFQWAQCRYSSASATCAFTLFFPASSSFFLLHSSSLHSGYTPDVNAIVFPSGDQIARSAPVESFVSGCGSPPSIDSRYTCPSPLLEEMNAIIFPSGDHTGEESFP